MRPADNATRTGHPSRIWRQRLAFLLESPPVRSAMDAWDGVAGGMVLGMSRRIVTKSPYCVPHDEIIVEGGTQRIDRPPSRNDGNSHKNRIPLTAACPASKRRASF